MSDIRIKASRCSECDKVIVPPRDLCPYCRHKSKISNVIELSNEGKVLSVTELHMPPEGFTPPMKMALVELEFGAVVLCLGEEDTDFEVEIGSLVELTVDDEERLRFRIVQ
ncbi:MAG: OB-fold domain-containing protein [Candidatus Thorarchaeota archaeon]|nr:OB-fold domain-containing protein [Candidatus Thorarchaeota archaeon]